MSIHSRFFGHNQFGDTIVEVVIAMAVIAVVLTGAFVVTNHSLTAVRDSEEHSEALNLLQGQVEDLRNASPSNIPNSSPWCFDASGKQAKTANDCIQNSQGAPNTSNSYYKLSFTKCTTTSICPSSGVGTNTYVFTVTWPSLSGGTDQEQLTYRI
jgi:type II secretory pathway pseudopilin PulG